jgi:bifunctional UDP-N-acetylglucosamine pyrophosphorylase / glucosamine-1-phosphate N-acetyltransferase
MRIGVAILAAGLGTRMRSRRAKVLHEAGGAPLIEHVVRAATAVAQAEDIAVVVGHQAEEVRAAATGFGVRFVDQMEQRGTGHAVQMCKSALRDGADRVLILYGDCPLLRPATLQSLVDQQGSSGAAGLVITTMVEDAFGYGRIVRDEAGFVAAIVEEKAANAEQKRIREINSGIYCLDAGPLWDYIGELTPNPASGEIYLTDLVEVYRRHGLRIAALPVADSSELLGINSRVELADVDRILRERKTRELMLSGVTIERPETVTIDAFVEAGQDTVIEPFAQLRGRTKVGEDCRIGAGVILRDSEIADGVVLEPYTVIRESRVGQGAIIGPFARLRPDNEVAAGARIGNFVELKKTYLGAGSKAMHLAYLGDSRIGEGVIVGAGTITCNYDGRKKHPTSIGKGAFVGSNSTLVAPVEIGEGAYVAAGSVVTETVPEDTLVLGRARQVNKPGWPSKRRHAAE